MQRYALIIWATIRNRGDAYFIPTLAAAGYLHQFLSAVDRTGINPVPTVDVCNTLVINGLST